MILRMTHQRNLDWVQGPDRQRLSKAGVSEEAAWESLAPKFEAAPLQSCGTFTVHLNICPSEFFCNTV